MPAYKDNTTGTWFVKFYSKDWTGENRQIKKRGFATKRDALDYERNYKIRQENNLDIELILLKSFLWICRGRYSYSLQMKKL